MTRASFTDLAIVAAPVLVIFGLAGGFFLHAQNTLQSAIDRREVEGLRAVFPDASRFSTTRRNPPFAEVFASDPQTDQERVIGLAFYTDELAPYERGYDGPIRMLVGLDLTGRITRVQVLEHHEPYGYFSIDTPDFVQQFIGKPVGDRFRVGDDIDAIARATITVVSATRAIGSTARRIARTYLEEREAIR